MRTRVLVISTLFYVAVAALLAGVLFKIWPQVLPASLATRIGHNSEGYILTLVIAPWIQFVRPRLSGTRAEWIVTILAGLAFGALTVYLLTGHGVASRFKTLNEGTLAAALLLPYVQIRRPFPRMVALVAAVVLIAVTVVTNRTSETTDMAETYGMLVLGVVGFDVVDRGILDPSARTSAPLRYGWYAFLVIAPIVFSLAEYHFHAGDTGVVGTPIRFLVRITEAFVFALFTTGFFAVGLGRTGRTADASDPAPAPTAPEPVAAP
jgi:hypothetical protein